MHRDVGTRSDLIAGPPADADADRLARRQIAAVSRRRDDVVEAAAKTDGSDILASDGRTPIADEVASTKFDRVDPDQFGDLVGV